MFVTIKFPFENPLSFKQFFPRILDLASRRPQKETHSISGNFRSLQNTNPSENSENTAETSRARNSEVSSQMSRKLEEMKSDLNSHILNVMYSAIEEKLIPSIRNALRGKNLADNMNPDLRSDGPHPSSFSSVRPQRDFRSIGPHQEFAGRAAQDTRKDFLRLVARSSNHRNHQKENSVDSRQSDVDDGYDMLTGANYTPQIVPEFLTGQPMQSRNKTPHQQCINDDTLDKTLPAQQIPAHTKTQTTNSEPPVDPINRLADVIIKILFIPASNKPLQFLTNHVPKECFFLDFRGIGSSESSR